MTILEYRGLFSSFYWDNEQQCFFGMVTNSNAVITFQGKTIDEIEQAFVDSVDEYKDWIAEDN